MDDDVGPHAPHCRRQGLHLERIDDDGFYSQRFQAGGLGGLTRRTDYVVLRIPQQQR
jgi:hypothetical protein